MVLVQGPARSKRSSLAWSYAKGGDSCVYSRKLCGRPPMLGVTVHPSKRARSGALVPLSIWIVACVCVYLIKHVCLSLCSLSVLSLSLSFLSGFSLVSLFLSFFLSLYK